MTSRAFSAWRMTTMPPTASPLPSRSAMPRRISGPSATDATSRSRTGVPRSSVLSTTCSEVRLRLHVAAPADHVLPAGQLEQPAAHLAVAASARRSSTSMMARSYAARRVRIDRHLVLLDEARRSRPPRRRPAPTAARSAGSSPGSVRRSASDCVPESSTSAYWNTQPTPVASGPSSVFTPVGQLRLDLRQVLEHAAARPVDVGAVLEDDVDVAEAEVREAADRLDLRRAEQRRRRSDT